MDITSIIGLVVTYGPQAVTLVENLVNRLENGQTLSVADVQAEFAVLKPYDGYHIKLASQASS